MITERGLGESRRKAWFASLYSRSRLLQCGRRGWLDVAICRVLSWNLGKGIQENFFFSQDINNTKDLNMLGQSRHDQYSNHLPDSISYTGGIINSIMHVMLAKI
jgi:hypothetical protein